MVPFIVIISILKNNFFRIAKRRTQLPTGRRVGQSVTWGRIKVLSRKWPQGTKTSRIATCIAEGVNTLRAISARTCIHYRCVNAIVDSLERQFRVEAANYDMPRCEQTFMLIPDDQRLLRRSVFADRMVETHRAKKKRAENPRNVIKIPSIPVDLHRMFCIRPASLPDCHSASRVHRLS